MPRKPSPDPVPYLRLILGISMNKRHLSIDEMNRLDFATAIVRFVSIETARKPAMAAFINKFMAKNGVSKSFCYNIKAKLEELTILKWDDYWQEYRLNMERWKRDKKALDAFKAQVKVWMR